MTERPFGLDGRGAVRALLALSAGLSFLLVVFFAPGGSSRVVSFVLLAIGVGLTVGSALRPLTFGASAAACIGYGLHVVASLAQESAVAAAGAVLGDVTAAADVAVTYLSQGKVGPLRTTAQVVRVDGPVALVRVEVTDPGLRDDDGEARLVVVAHVHCVRRSA